MIRSLAIFLLPVLLTPPAVAADRTVLRLGHFPNVTHAQAVIAHGLSREGKGWFEERLGAEVDLQWFVYNAGPSAMEAIFTKAVDLTYVGPNPAINAHLRSRGDEVRIVAGACSGGAALVVKENGALKVDADFKGRKLATPQLGNTQDVAARAWLKSKGHRVTLTGGDELVVPTANPDQLALFRKGDIDAVWTVEPWVSRLVLETGGAIYLDESTLWPQTGGKYVTTHLVSSVSFLEKQSALLRQFIAAHIELTEWIKANPDEAKRVFNEEIKAETTRPLPKETLDRAWSKLELTWDPVWASLLKSAEDAHAVGFLRQKPDLSRIYDLAPLNGVLRAKGLKEVR